MSFNQREDLSMDLRKSLGNGNTGSQNETIVDDRKPRSFSLNHPIAHPFQTGVDTENDQGL